jgi:hypothetical protein
MEKSQKTAREIYLELKSNLSRKRFGFGKKAIFKKHTPELIYLIQLMRLIQIN